MFVVFKGGTNRRPLGVWWTTLQIFNDWPDMIVSQEPSRSQRHIRKTQDKAFPTVKEHRGVEGVRGPASIEKTVLELIERSGACMPNSRS